MKEIIIYTIAALAGLWVLGYSIHMLVGGLVSPETERRIIIGSVLVGIAVIGFMVHDVVKHRKNTLDSED